MQPYILVMEDEDALATLLQYNLEKEGYDVVIASDGEEGLVQVDEHYNALFRELLTYMMGDPRTINACTHLLFMAKNLERIGDHATNIAETVHYEITGDEMIGERPRGAPGASDTGLTHTPILPEA